MLVIVRFGLYIVAAVVPHFSSNKQDRSLFSSIMLNLDPEVHHLLYTSISKPSDPFLRTRGHKLYIMPLFLAQHTQVDTPFIPIIILYRFLHLLSCFTNILFLCI